MASCFVLLAASLLGLSGGSPATPPAGGLPASPSVHFEDVTAAAKIPFVHHNGDGTFTDVTARSGLDVEMYGMGAAVGDFDNDGWDDLYITGLGESRLFHNEHNGTFKDVTKSAGVNNTGFGASAVWLDYDRDGKLDLFVTNYVKWSEKGDIVCKLDGVHKSYCTPEAYQ